MKNKKKKSSPKIGWVFRTKATKAKKKSSSEIECVFGPNEDRDHIK